MRSDTWPSTNPPHIGAQCITLPLTPAAKSPSSKPPRSPVSGAHSAPSQVTPPIIPVHAPFLKETL